MQNEETRNMKVSFSRERLHSSIAGALRRRRIPRDLRGYDLIRGVIFGLVDHPEYTLEVALQRAVDVSKIPGSPTDLEEAYLQVFDCIEPVMRVCDFHQEGDVTKPVLSEKEIIQKFMDSVVYDVKKDYCYSSTINFMREKKFKDYFAYEILKNMIFKKLIADDSTEECMYEYAFRKTFVNPGHKTADEIRMEVDSEVKAILPKGETLYTYVLKCVNEIREKDC
ncbi:MAG: hypothetical protein ACI4VN_03280 [Clostridia bacterium]